MEVPNIFKSPTSADDRQKKLEKIRKNRYQNPSGDFMSYGYDYFDNAEIHSGYRHYTYDGRFEEPVGDVIETFGLTKDMKVADYGCAKGYLLYEFKKKGHPVIGFERSEYAITEAQPELKDDIVQCSDPAVLGDHSFDFLMSRCVLPHMDTDSITQLIELAIKNTRTKPYFVIHTFEIEAHREDYRYWDRTHVSIMNADQWREFMKPFSDKLFFSLDYLF